MKEFFCTKHDTVKDEYDEFLIFPWLLKVCCPTDLTLNRKGQFIHALVGKYLLKYPKYCGCYG